MEPIIVVNKPTALIGQIRVYPAIYNDLHFLQYPVEVDDIKLTFHLDGEACWVYRETIILPDEVRHIVGDLIEGLHN